MMRQDHRPRVVALRRLLVGAALGGVGIAGAADAQSALTVDTSASAGISTNPYLGTGSTPSAGTLTLDVRPSYVIQRPLTTLSLSGDANVAFYTQRYGTNESFSLNGAVEHKLSAYTTLTGSVGYVNSILGSYNDVRVPVGLPVLENDLPLFVADPALGAIGRRNQIYQAAIGLSSTLSPRDRLSGNVAVSANRFGGGGFNDFNYFAPSVAYSRAVGQGFDVGATLSVGFTDYLGTRIGDATIYQPQATLSHRLGSRWTLNAAAGVGIAKVRNATGTDTSSTTFNGSIGVCRQDDRWNACFNGSRQTAPSSYQGVRTQTSLSASVGYRVNANDDLSISASYSNAGDPVQDSVLGGVRSGGVNYVTASANYSHRFRPALSGFVSTGATKAYGDNVPRGANFTAQVGVNYRFGRR